jgi:hypothetical protein
VVGAVVRVTQCINARIAVDMREIRDAGQPIQRFAHAAEDAVDVSASHRGR